MTVPAENYLAQFIHFEFSHLDIVKTRIGKYENFILGGFSLGFGTIFLEITTDILDTYSIHSHT